jgi:transcriptional regulator with XRE-family HTH domain
VATRRRDRGSTVAENLKAAIGETPVNAWAVAHKLDQPTVRRILIGETSPTEAMIERLADALGLEEAWQLLVPGLKVANPPVIRDATANEKKLYAKIEAAISELADLRAANTESGSLS